MKMALKVTTISVLSLLGLSACSSTGLDASSQFKCRLGDTVGSGCKSISQVYAETGSNSRSLASNSNVNEKAVRRTPYSGMPIRTPVKVLRVWVAPWEDRDGDLRDQSFMYLALNESRWQIGHNLESIMDDYSPSVRLLGSDKSTSNLTQKVESGFDKTNMNGLGIDKTQDPLSQKPNLVPPPIAE